MNKTRLYRCIGENFKDNCRVGYCGDVHTLLQWLVILIPHKSEQEIEAYFEGDTDTVIKDYIFDMFGKRLEKC